MPVRDKAHVHTLEHYIDGNWVKRLRQSPQDVINPSNSKGHRRARSRSRGDLDKALAAVGQRLKTCARCRLRAARSAAQAADLVRTRADDIAKVLTQEQGKVLAEAKMEID